MNWADETENEERERELETKALEQELRDNPEKMAAVQQQQQEELEKEQQLKEQQQQQQQHHQRDGHDNRGQRDNYQRSNYNNNYNNRGGYNNNRGGYNNQQQQQQQQQGGFNNRNSGYQRDNNNFRGGYNNQQQQGGFNNNQRNNNSGGGYGNYNNNNNQRYNKFGNNNNDQRQQYENGRPQYNQQQQQQQQQQAPRKEYADQALTVVVTGFPDVPFKEVGYFIQDHPMFNDTTRPLIEDVSHSQKNSLIYIVMKNVDSVEQACKLNGECLPDHPTMPLSIKQLAQSKAEFNENKQQQQHQHQQGGQQGHHHHQQRQPAHVAFGQPRQPSFNPFGGAQPVDIDKIQRERDDKKDDHIPADSNPSDDQPYRRGDKLKKPMQSSTDSTGSNYKYDNRNNNLNNSSGGDNKYQRPNNKDFTKKSNDRLPQQNKKEVLAKDEEGWTIQTGKGKEPKKDVQKATPKKETAAQNKFQALSVDDGSDEE